ncbi:hypothetical protein S83_045129 [Arachis hypogaea]
MPFPWKKNRVTRISQIVADLQSPRRGGSLVVETGFPTSLIDLFVKNRSRFTRTKSKRPLQPGIYDPPPPPPSTPVLSPVPETSSSGDLSVVRAHAPSLTPLVTVNDGGDDGGVSGSEEVIRVGECGCESYSKSVLASSVKWKALFLVVVLISSVMKLTVGITVSAVTLLFLENVGKRFVGWWRTVGIKMEPFTVTVCNCVWFQKLMKLKSKKEDHCEEVAGGGGVGLMLLNDTVEVVESESRSEVGDCCEKKWLEDVADSCEEGSRSIRFTWKGVKKLVPKKWRSSLRKRSKESEGESRRSGEEDKCSREEEVDDSNGMIMTWVEEEEEEGEEGVIRIHEVGKCCSWGHVIVLVTVLGGLLMGRLAALVLTLASCFLFKMLLRFYM